MIIYFPTYIKIKFGSVNDQLNSRNIYDIGESIKSYAIIHLINYGRETITFPNGMKKFAHDDYKFIEYMIDLNDHGYFLNDIGKKYIAEQVIREAKDHVRNKYEMTPILNDNDCVTYVTLPTYFTL